MDRNLSPGGKTMPAFHEILIKENDDLLDRARSHPFMSRVFSGAIPDEMLQEWIQQEFLLVQDWQRFITSVAARAPGIVRNSVFESVINFRGEIEVFEEFAIDKGAEKAPSEVNLARHSLASFLLATVEYRSFEEALAACLGINLAHTEAVTAAMQSTVKASAWWGGYAETNHHESFGRFVDSLIKSVNKVAEAASAESRQQMTEIFHLSVRYMLAYWDSFIKES